MDFKQLEAFVYVIKYQSYTRAAKELFLTQPTVSAHIASLEKELGVNLVVRSTRSVTASHWGEILYEYAVDLLNLRDSALEVFRNAERAEQTNIAIAASTVPAQVVLPEVLAAFCERHPAISFAVSEKDSAQVVQLVAEQSVDLGFTGTKLPHAKCIFTPFLEDSLVVVTPAGGAYAALRPADLTAQWLREQPFLLREPGSGTRREAEKFLRAMGVEPDALRIAAQLDRPEQILRMVQKGAGITVLSYRSAREYERRGEVRTFALPEVDMRRRLYLVRNKNRPLCAAAKQFVRFVCEYHAAQHAPTEAQGAAETAEGANRE